MADANQPKIHVDDDWKSSARAEKERLAAEAEAKKAAAGEGGEGAGGPEGPLGFTDMVRMFATQALMYLGAFPDPQTGKAMLAPEMAKANIDLLGVLQEKTKGNLTDDEQQIIDQTLHELRLQFVEINRAVERAIAEGKISPSGEYLGDPTSGGQAPGAAGPGGPVGL